MDITSFLLGYESGKSTGGGNLESVDVVLDEISGEVITGSTVDKLNYLDATKATIKNAIISKGQTVLPDDTFRSFADKILNIGIGGNKWKFAHGGFEGTEAGQLIEHNLGVYPDIFLVWCNRMVDEASSIYMSLSYSEAVFEAVGNDPETGQRPYLGRHLLKTIYGSTFSTSANFGMDKAANMQTGMGFGMLRNPTPTTVYIGAGTDGYRIEAGKPYAWIAFGGIF